MLSHPGIEGMVMAVTVDIQALQYGVQLHPMSPGVPTEPFYENLVEIEGQVLHVQQCTGAYGRSTAESVKRYVRCCIGSWVLFFQVGLGPAPSPAPPSPGGASATQTGGSSVTQVRFDPGRCRSHGYDLTQAGSVAKCAERLGMGMLGSGAAGVRQARRWGGEEASNPGEVSLYLGSR